MTESELIEKLEQSKNVLLIEPDYKRQYIPLGLAKIATFIESNNGQVTYSRTAIPNKPDNKFDLICITTMFTTDIDKVLKTIRECQQSLFLRNVEIIVGGIAGTLMSDYIKKKTNIKNIFTGYSKILDKIVPDYSINWKVNDVWNSFSTVFTSRGCNNNCAYCAVNKLEPDFWINPNWKNCIVNEKENVKISDNNLLFCSEDHQEEVLKFLAESKKGVLFNNGIYAKLITNRNAALLSKLKYVRFGLRTAFDRIEEDGYFQKGIEKLINAGCNLQKDCLSYVLFNFIDSPQDAYYRVTECWKYKAHPYAMQYRPLKETKKGKYIGKYWTHNLVRAFKNYVELYGYNRYDHTFETWQKSDKTKIKLTDEDWDKWYYKK
jgi:hypothetical protein